MITREANAIVAQRIEVAPGLIKLRVVPNGWELPDFTPGQYSILGLPGSAARCPSADPQGDPLADPDKLILRAYSVASSSVAKAYLEYYIALVYSGSLTPRLFNLKIGDKLWLSTHFSGMFTLSDVPNELNAVLIATGTGLAPYMSMIRTEAAEGLRHRFAVIHGARHSWDLGYNNELRTLDLMAKNFNYFPIISEPEREWTPWKGYRGFVQKIWEDGALDKAWGFHPTPKDTHIFLCGNPMMIDGMIRLLGKEGFIESGSDRPGQIHLEKYD
nr:ferredoxin--NADP reductase [candidate division Zixibacteria bacterium]